VSRNLFEYRHKPAMFTDSWETAQNWTVLWNAEATRVQTDPFSGSWCVKMRDNLADKPAGLSRDNIWPNLDPFELTFAMKLATPTGSEAPMQQVYFYNREHTRVAFIIGQYVSGLLFHWGAGGATSFYSGSINTWYLWRVQINFRTGTFTIWLYDRDGNLLIKVSDIAFANLTVIETTAHMLLYSPIANTGTYYWDAVEVDP